MPIVVSNQPAQLIGNLAQNAGNFATGQAQQQMGLEQARFADSQRRGDEELQMRRDQLAQQADLAKQHIQAQVMAHVLSSMSQQQLEKLRDDARMKQIGAQGQNQQTLAGINGSNRANVAQMNIDSREGIADTRDTTQQRGQDLRTGVAYDKMDQQSDQFGQTYDQRDRSLDQRDRGLENQQTYQQGRLAIGQSHNTMEGQRQDRLQMGQKLDLLRAQAHILQSAIKANPYRPETQKLREQLNVISKSISDLGAKATNEYLGQTRPPVQSPPMQPPMQPAPMPATAPAQDFGQGMVMPQPAMQPPSVNPDVIRQLVLEGYTNEEIKAMIRGQ